MVVRANQAYGELGGHIASYASAAELFEWASTTSSAATTAARRAAATPTWCTSSRIRRRACIRAPSSKGRLSEEQLANYRQEVGGRGLCSTRTRG
jgi:pyruvate dehydrogenase E1 component